MFSVCEKAYSWSLNESMSSASSAGGTAVALSINAPTTDCDTGACSSTHFIVAYWGSQIFAATVKSALQVDLAPRSTANVIKLKLMKTMTLTI